MALRADNKIRGEIIEAGVRVYSRGYVASNDGNISSRLGRDRILITPTGVSKGFMNSDDLIILDLNGNVIKGKKKPSSETAMHLNIYKDRPDINSICHAHPPYATGFAVAGIPLTKMILPEVIIVLGKIPLVEYGTTGTKRLYSMIAKYISDYDAFLLANHGAVTLGKDVMDAYYKMETLEHAAHIQFIAKQLGSIKTLRKTQTEELIALRDKFGIRKTVGFQTKIKSNKK